MYTSSITSPWQRLRLEDEERTKEIVRRLMLSKSDGVVVFINADARRLKITRSMQH